MKPFDPLGHGHRVPRDFEGRRALVVGGASGIGAATVRELVARGAVVTIADVDEASKGFAEEVGPSCAAIHIDVTDEDSVDAAFRSVAESGIDTLVNAAGVSGAMTPLAELAAETWDQTMAVNLRGCFLTTRAALPLLLANESASLVNVASGAGLRGVPMLADYAASKHGVIGLTKSVVAEHARSGLRANVVCPGTIRTPMLERFAGGEEGMEQMGRYSPGKRLGEPFEIASAIVWLSSDSASFISGSVLEADGGIAAL